MFLLPITLLPVTRSLGLLVLSLFIAGCGSKPVVSAAHVTTLTVALANTHIVDTQGVRIMIDSGKHGDELKLLEEMAAAGIAPESIDYLILTHGHTDHAGGAALFQRQFGTKVIASRAEKQMLAAGKNGVLCPTTLLARFLQPSIERESYPPVVADIWVDDSFDLQALGIVGEVVAVPSHTAGSLAVIIGENAFVGDLLRGELLSKTQPARHFYMCDLQTNDRDIQQILAYPNVRNWYTGHMGPVSAEAVRQSFQP